MTLSRVRRSPGAIMRELRAAARATGDLRSFLRYSGDILLYRVLGVTGRRPSNKLRGIRLRDGARISYRANRGDIQTVREVWLAETYRLPFEVNQLDTVVDLGANIGLTSVYLARRYHARRLIAVEPLRANAELARLNFEQNHIESTLIEAAVGAKDGMVRFSADTDFNLGRVGPAGSAVRSMSMSSILLELEDVERIDLLKVDIEGAEGPLLNGRREWLDRVENLIVEFHPDRLDPEPLVRLLSDEGFSHIPGGSVHANTTDTFVRIGPSRSRR